jgi:hypothetical protein
VRVPSATLACAAALGAACGGSSDPRPSTAPARAAPPDHVIPQRPLAAGPRLVEPAPGWVEEFCAEVVRRSDLGCPTLVPAGFAQPDFPPERPTARGFTLLGADGWSIEGDRRRRGGRLAAARVEQAGDVAVLRFGRYVLAAPAGDDAARVRRQLRAVARGMSRG